MKNAVITLDSASNLPEEWDAASGSNIFLTRKMLGLFEKHNPCGQQYHMFYKGRLDSILVTYRLDLDLLTYKKRGLMVPVTIAGIPASVSKPGYAIGDSTKDDVYHFLNNISGGRVILNCPHPMNIGGFHRGNTLPTCRLDIKWGSFDNYLDSMRSHYRYRFKKALGKFGEVSAVELEDNKLFDESLYDLYLDVFNRSRYKLEKMPIDFFRDSNFQIIKFELGKKPLGFVQMLPNDKELIFVLGGFDYSINFKYDLYTNMLLEVIKRGIEGNFRSVDLGQTAEDTKAKLGSEICPRYLYGSHSNSLINFTIARGVGFLSYKQNGMSFNTFKGDKS